MDNLSRFSYNGARGGSIMDKDFLEAAYVVGRFFCSDILAFYQDTYKGDLGKVQVEAMDYLHMKGACGIKELSQRLNISKQHASKIASRLEEIGYASRSRDSSDGRSCLYTLTEEGQAFIGNHIASSNRHLDEILESLSAEEQRELRESFLTSARILESLVKEQGIPGAE